MRCSTIGGITSWLIPRSAKRTARTISSRRAMGLEGSQPRPLDRLAKVSPGENGDRSPRVLAIDAGGTMTDTFIVDESGSFVVGKAQTTPDDESAGFMDSARDALKQWESSPEEAFG